MTHPLSSSPIGLEGFDRCFIVVCEQLIIVDVRDILSVVQSLRMIRSVPPSVMEVVTGLVEIWIARTLYAYLKSIDATTAWLDARDVLVVRGGSNTGLGEKGNTSTGGVVPMWVETARRMEGWRETVGRAERRRSSRWHE